MTSATNDDDEKAGPGRILAAIIFAACAIAFVAVAVGYVIVPPRDLPGFMGAGNSGGHHTVRAAGSLAFAVAFALGSWFALRYRSLALEEAREADRLAAERALEVADEVTGVLDADRQPDEVGGNLKQ